MLNHISETESVTSLSADNLKKLLCG